MVFWWEALCWSGAWNPLNPALLIFRKVSIWTFYLSCSVLTVVLLLFFFCFLQYLKESDKCVWHTDVCVLLGFTSEAYVIPGIVTRLP